MTATLEPSAGVGRRRRTLPWYAFGLANLAVVVVLSLVSWYLVADPEWSASGIYPQPLTAWMFWTIIAFVWAAFTFELSPFARLRQPWKGLAVAVVTGGLGALITWLLAAGWGSVDASFDGARAEGAGFILGSLIVLYSFVVYVISAVNWGHWPWTRSGLQQPWLGAASFGALVIPVVVLYMVFAVPSMAMWAPPDAALLDPYTQIGFFYCVVVSAILTGAVLENWPWRLAGSPGRTALAALVGNLVIGWILYEALVGVTHLVLGSANVAAIGETLPMFGAQVGVCWVFWMVMWPNAFGNRPTGGRLGVVLVGRTLITFVLAVLTFALYYYVLAGVVLHEPAAADGATVSGSALVGMDWLIIWALWYVVAGESWGLPRPHAAVEEETS
ncbi:hypothetical protein [Actinomycetospora flava]|uniref:AAT family amino acid transporter n=1 Tax=Actinomycetospora flava TaxID=3129232 RepID=A0ABU8M4H7_9PSEU